METDELKHEINQIVDHLPNELLGDVLDYLRQVGQSSSNQVQLTQNLRRILREDKELLTRLAQ